MFSGYLAKGQNSGPFPGFLHSGTGEELQVNVTSDGQVELDWIAGSNFADAYEMRVMPDPVFSAGQVQAISLPQLSPNPTVTTNGSSFSLTYSGGEGAVTPDPCVVSFADSYLGVFMGQFI